MRAIRYFIFSVFLFLAALASAAPYRTTYQAKIIKPDGFPLQASSVNFRFSILDPAATCVIYTEDYSAVNMTDTGGVIAFALGAGVRSFPTSGTAATFTNIFDNATPSFPCQTVGVYIPTSQDGRKIVMQFNDGAGWQTLPAMTINAVPYSMYAGKAENSLLLNGKVDTSFVEYSTLAAMNCQANEAIHFNGVSFSCLAVGTSSTAVTSGSVVTALGYTPANATSFTTLSSSMTSTIANVASVSSSIFSVSSTVSSLQGTVTSLQSSIAASFAAISGTGVQNLNGSSSGTQTFANATSGTTPAFVTANGVHTLNIPFASAATTTAGLISNSDFVNFTNKIASSAAAVAQVLGFTPANQTTVAASFTALTSTVNTNTASITALTTTVNTHTTSITGLTTSATNLTATANTNSASITALTTTVNAHTTSLTNLTSTANTNSSSITAITTTVNTHTTSITALTTTVNNHTTSLTSLAASMSAISSSQWATSGSTINYGTGNVGIGTTAPSQALEVSGSAKANRFLAADGVFNAPSITFASSPGTGFYNNGGYLGISIGGGLQGTWTSSSLGFNAGGAGPQIYFSGGNAANPSYAFNVDSDTGMFNPNAGGGSNELGFSTAGLERLRIASAGTVGIGITAPTAKLHLASGTSSVGALKFTSGTLLTSPQSGSVEYDGYYYYITDGANTRRTIATVASPGTFDNASTITSTGNITMVPIGSVVVSSTTASTNSTTGALVVTGGVGVGGNINVAGNSNVSGTLTATTTISPYIAGSVQASGNLTIDSTTHATKGKILINPNGGYTGIGTSNPVAVLDVMEGSGYLRSNTLDGGLEIGSGNDHSSYIDFHGISNLNNDYTGRIHYMDNLGMGLYVSGNAYPSIFIVSSTGNVGIGTSSPTARLEVSGSMVVGNTTGANSILLNDINTAEWSIATGAYGLSFKNDYDDNGVYDTRMFFSKEGYLGVGTSAPTVPVHVLTTGNANISIQTTASGAGGAAVNLVTASNSGMPWQLVKRDDGYLGAPVGSFMINNSSIAPLVITSAGAIGVGTSTPQAQLDVNGSIRSTGIAFVAPPGDPAPTISTRTVPAGQGAANEKTELILFHTNDFDNGAGIDQITLRAPALSFQTYNDATVSNINDNNGYNERMYITPTGYVGVGTVSPTLKFQVADGAIFSTHTGTNTGVYMSAHSSGYGLIQASNANNTGAKDLQMQQYGGNLGVGGVTPGARFEVSNATSAVVRVLAGTGNGVDDDNLLRLMPQNSGSEGGHMEFKGALSYSDWTVDTVGGELRFFEPGQSRLATKTRAGITFTVNSSVTSVPNTITGLRITNTGAVGLGTTTPLRNLHMQATGSAEMITESTAVTAATQGRIWRSRLDPATAFFNFDAMNSDLTAGTTILTMSSSGTVGINATTPQTHLQLGASNYIGILPNGYQYIPASWRRGNAGGMIFAGSQNSDGTGWSYGSRIVNHDYGNGLALSFDSLNVGTWTNDALVISGRGVPGYIGVGTASPSEKLHVVGNLRVQGSTDCTLGNGAGGTNCSSDARLKEHIKPIPYALDKVLTLKGVEFDWNAKSQSQGRHDIGVIAQDVEKVFPTAVMDDKGTGYKKVDYAVLVAPLIQAVKEFYTFVTQRFEKIDRQIASKADASEVELLKVKSNKLEAENAELKKQNEAIKAYLCSQNPQASICK